MSNRAILLAVLSCILAALVFSSTVIDAGETKPILTGNEDKSLFGNNPNIPEDVRSHVKEKISNAPIGLRGKFKVTDSARDYTIKRNPDKTLSITKAEETGKSTIATISFPEAELNTLPGYDGDTFAIAHVVNGTVESFKKVKTKSVSKNGIISLDVEFSEVIIGGATGYYEVTYQDVSLMDTTLPFNAVTNGGLYINIVNLPTYTAFDQTNISTYPDPSKWLAAYPFNGNGEDISGNNRDLTVYGSKVYRPGRNGVASNSLYFDGDGDYVGYEYPNTLYTSAEMVWLFNTTSTAQGVTGEFREADGSGRTAMYNSEAANMLNNSTSQTQKWTEVADGTWNWAFYPFSPAQIDYIQIGRRYTSTYYYLNAYLDMAALHEGSLTAEQRRVFTYGYSGIKAKVLPGSTWIPITSNNQSITTGSSTTSVQFMSPSDTQRDVTLKGLFQLNYTKVRDWTESPTTKRIDMTFAPAENITSGTLNHSITKSYLYGTPTVTSDDTSASVELNGNYILVTTGAITADTTKYYNVSLPIKQFSLGSPSPASTPVNLIETDEQEFQTTANATTDIVWALNGSTLETDEFTTSGTYTFVANTPGTYELTATVPGDTESWIINVEPISITSYYPLGTSITVTAGTSTPIFNVTVDRSTDIEWWVDGVLKETDTGTSANYSFVPVTAGTSNVTVDVGSATHSWELSITEPGLTPYSWYAFNTGSGSTVYDSIGGYNGTLSNGEWIPKGSGYAAKITDAANSHIVIPDNDKNDHVNESWTMYMEVCPLEDWDEASTYQKTMITHMSSYYGTGSGWAWIKNKDVNTGKFGFRSTAAGAGAWVSGTVVSWEPYQWYRIGVTFDITDKRVKFYRDGTYIGGSYYGLSYPLNPATTFPLYIGGAMSTSSSAPKMYVDNIKFYDGAISQSNMEYLTTWTSTGPTVYVATTGNDSFGTGAEGAPYATVGKALSASLNEVVMIKGGNYSEHVIINRDNVTLHGYGGVVNFDGFDDTGIAINASNRSNITLENLNIMNYETGMYAAGTLNNLQISNCSITSSGHGMYINDCEVDGLTISDSEIGDNQYTAIYLATAGTANSIANVILTNNELFDCGSSLLDLYSGISNVIATGNTYSFENSTTQDSAVKIRGSNVDGIVFTGEQFTNCDAPFTNLNGQNIMLRDCTFESTNDHVYIIGGESGASPLGTFNFTGENNTYSNMGNATVYTFSSTATSTPGSMRDHNATFSGPNIMFGNMQANVDEDVVVTTNNPARAAYFGMNTTQAMTWEWYKNSALVETDNSTTYPQYMGTGLVNGDNITAIYQAGSDTLQVSWITAISGNNNAFLGIAVFLSFFGVIFGTMYRRR